MKNNRRTFIARAAALASLAAIPFPGLGMDKHVSVEPLPSLNGKRVLLIYGGYAPHEPEKYAAYLIPWLKGEGAEVQAFTTLESYADKSIMNNIDLVIQTFTQERITKEQEDGLLEAVEKNGAGLAGWHGGLCDTFHDNERYHFMTGGIWVAHPGGVIDYEVKVVDQKDSVTHGLKNFHMKSEQYYMHVDPNIKVLATTQFNGKANDWIDGCVIPVTWKKMHGKGRVFYTSIGHNLSHVQEQPDAMEMLKRGIRWASASKYAAPEKWLSPVYGRL